GSGHPPDWDRLHAACRLPPCRRGSEIACRAAYCYALSVMRWRLTEGLTDPTHRSILIPVTTLNGAPAVGLVSVGSCIDIVTGMCYSFVKAFDTTSGRCGKRASLRGSGGRYNQAKQHDSQESRPSPYRLRVPFAAAVGCACRLLSAAGIFPPGGPRPDHD